MLSLALPVADMRFTSAAVKAAPRGGGGDDDCDDKSCGKDSASDISQSAWVELEATVSLPSAAAAAHNTSGVVAVEATVCLRVTWATAAHNGSLGEVKEKEREGEE